MNTINPAEYLELLFHFWCHQVLVDGTVQTDPHPGNYFIMNPQSEHHDKRKQLGAIDFGQLKVLTLDKRLALSRLVLALQAWQPHPGGTHDVDGIN